MITKWVIILLIFVSVGPHKSYADDSVKCISAPSEEEVFKLLSFVKNNVLGTIPKFCREGSPSQLSDQVDDSEKELSNFVSALKIINPNEKNISKLKKEDFDDTVIQTAKVIILKKIWAQSSDSNQYDLLLSKECGPLGLNRVPIHEKNKKIVKGESSIAYQKAIKVCDSYKIENLTPYLTKDVLAETLLNLRRIFPEDFPKLLGSLCDGIKITDESLLKNNAYEDLLISEKPVSAKSFSVWIKGLYQKYKPSEDSSVYYYDNSKANPSQAIKYMKDDFDRRQAYLKVAYESLLQGDETLLKGSWEAINVLQAIKKSGGTIEKNPKGVYVMKKGPTNNNENDEKQLKMFEELAIEAYEKGKLDDANLLGVPFKKGSAALILKGEDGKLKYKIAEEDRKIILEKAKIAKINIDKKRDENSKNSYYQAVSKARYELEELQEGDEFSRPTIEKTPEGLYKNFPNSDEILGEKVYEKFIEKFGGDIASDGYGYTYYVKVDGEVVPVGYNKSAYQATLKYQAEQKKAQGFTLHQVLKETYQNNSSDFDKIKNIPPEKIEALKEYTGDGSAAINGCLRKGTCNKTQQKKAADIVEVLKKAQIESEDSRILYRGTAQLPPQILNSLKKNPKNFVLDKGFLSTSADLNTARGFSTSEKKGFLFIIKAKSCVGIASISNVKYEDEFLCPPGMKFNVKKQSEDESKSTYVLEEVSK